jgi:superfamily II DNA or RNA helicase
VGVELSFVEGTLVVRGLPPDTPLFADLKWDDRAHLHRAPAIVYERLVRALVAEGTDFSDHARAYETLHLTPRALPNPRPFQKEAVSAWKKEKSRGVVVLPTGAGKSHVALMAILERQRSTLVVAPTLDLVRQWWDLLRTTFAREVGLIGGGEHSLLPLTVTTYDSAYLHMDRIGQKFGLIVFDECHHLPGQSYSLIAQLCLAPYRLGLTATPERADGREEILSELIGPIAYRKEIDELSGEYLADYRTERIVIDLTEQERESYESARQTYLGFLRAQGISMGSPRGFSEFIMRASRSAQGRLALGAYREQRALAFAAAGKLEYLQHLLHRHRQDRTIVFTQDNATAYEVSRRFLVPVITHQTKVKERSEILSGFDEGRYRAIVTSKVLNEGVDVPSANVAVVVSGSGSVMEHVQRLGRILRRQGEKRATLYELVSRDTSEKYTSERRREHTAYQKHSFRGRST